MKRFMITVILFAATLFTSCSSITVTDDFLKNADLTSYKTFNWISLPKTAFIVRKEEPPNRSLIEKILKDSVNNQLTIRGVSQNSDNPDLLISYLFGADVTNWNDLLYKGGNQDNLNVQQYKKGAILLDFVDGKTRELLWRVDASDIEGRNPTPDKIEKTIKETVAKMFKNFPSSSVR
jgi:hypothetical protein